jgi:hypothetical protein
VYLYEQAMSITISEAAERWGIDPEDIHRKQRAGKLNFATAEPPTVETSEMLRAFGLPLTNWVPARSTPSKLT